MSQQIHYKQRIKFSHETKPHTKKQAVSLTHILVIISLCNIFSAHTVREKLPGYTECHGGSQFCVTHYKYAPLQNEVTAEEWGIQ